MEFDLRLLELNHLENTCKTFLVNFPYHDSAIDSEIDFKQNKILKVDSEDDSLIFLQYIRNIKELKTTQVLDIIINKSDTVLLSKRLSFSEPELKVKKWGVSLGTLLDTNQYYNLNIKRNEGGYYIDKAESRLSFHMGKKKAYRKIENTIIFLNTENNINPKQLKELNGDAKQLFKLDANSSARFWEPYLSD